MSPILFWIYISRVFDVIEENNPAVIYLSFINNLGFIVFGTPVKEISQALDIEAFTVLHWDSINAVIYDTSKTETVLFSKSYCQRLNKQLCKTDIKVGNKKIYFNKKATRLLGVWLDNQLKFLAHINKKIRKARITKIQIKSLTKTHRLMPKLVQQIQLVVIQSIVLYGLEF